ncbi:TPA: helix-turn-helix transcriptional regulator [Staphylococcus aureus]|nr:helix-turn-helix transcriptional regulator [Staphylococcus aureus]HDG5489706.1 helix-turn-helix transcriptional regulator [Staphylococcus aureus]
MHNNLSLFLGMDRISASRLSMVTGISRASIHSFYHERTEKSDAKAMMKLCEHFNITLNEFFGINKKRGG